MDCHSKNVFYTPASKIASSHDLSALAAGQWSPRVTCRSLHNPVNNSLKYESGMYLSGSKDKFLFIAPKGRESICDILMKTGEKKLALCLRPVFTVTSHLKWLHCFYCKGWRCKGLLLVSASLPMAFSCTHYGSPWKLVLQSLPWLCYGNALRFAGKVERRRWVFLLSYQTFFWAALSC